MHATYFPPATYDRGDPPFERRRTLGRRLLRGALWLVWHAVRLPLLALLIILEPLVAVALSAAAVVGVVTACFIKLSGDLPHFPFWGMVGSSVGCMLLLMAYHAIRLFLSRWNPLAD